MRLRRIGVLVTGFTALAIAGCTAAPTAPPPTSPGAAYVSAYEAPAVPVPAPLSGVAVKPGSLDHPSLAAKIDNHPDARPQTGLERADIVFEELVEGGLTRYLAVWHSHIPADIGPVRSIRPMDPDIASPTAGLLAYSGGQPQFVAMIQATELVTATEGNPAFFRTTDNFAPHNLHVRAKQFVDANRDVAAPPPQHFAFSNRADDSSSARFGKRTTRIDVSFSTFSNPSWSWHRRDAAWRRTQSGAADLDASGRQLAATNVIVMRVAIDNSYGDVPKTVLVGSGDAWIGTGGSVLPVHWSKDSRTAPIRFTDAEGATVRVAPGNTWIELMPAYGSVDFAR
ncbi:MAG: DUF3048 domain-containing protein [Microbacterium sp.]|nr:DUF3048 domain-containing protein [Microbacterium sp.]